MIAKRPASWLRKFSQSAVFWSWAFNFLRLSGGLLILPLLITRLSTQDLGMYYVFLRLIALVPIIDFGFSVSIGRNVGYAAAGAKSLLAQGMPDEAASNSTNFSLLWRLLDASRRLYGFMGIGVLVLLGVWGTWNVSGSAYQTDDPRLTWTAWIVTLLAASLELYLGWWNSFLRGANQVLVACRYAVVGYSTQLVIGVILLLSGAGLLSLPCATLIGGLVTRLLSRRACLALLGTRPRSSRSNHWNIVRTLWPNSWRTGLQYLSVYLGTTVPGLLFARQYGLDAFAPYGLSYQLLMICSGMAFVWVQVKWPLVMQQRARKDLLSMRQTIWPRFFLQNVSYVILALAVVLIAPVLLPMVDSSKQMLPYLFLALVATSVFFDLQFTFWTTLVSTENRIPSLWPTVISQMAILALYLILAVSMELTYLALVVPPLLVGFAFNYWYWMFRGSASMGTNLGSFLMRRLG